MGNAEFQAIGDGIVSILEEVAANLFVAFFAILGFKISAPKLRKILKSKLHHTSTSKERNLVLTREYGYCIAQIVSLIMTSKVGTYEEHKAIIDSQIQTLNSIMLDTILYDIQPNKLIYLTRGSYYDINLYMYKYDDMYIYCTQGEKTFIKSKGNPIQTSVNVDGYYFILSLIECVMTDPTQTWEDRLNLLRSIENEFLKSVVDKNKPYIFQYNPQQVTLICTIGPYNINASLIINNENQWYYVTK